MEVLHGRNSVTVHTASGWKTDENYYGWFKRTPAGDDGKSAGWEVRTDGIRRLDGEE